MTVSLFARMLDSYEHRPAIGAPRDAGDFALLRPDHETANLSGRRVADQHLIVALAGIPFLIAVVAVGLDPQQAVIVERDPVRRIEHVALVDVFRSCVGIVVNCRIAGCDKQIPAEAGGRMIAFIRHPPDDLSEVVRLAGIRTADRSLVTARIGLHSAILVIGESD